MVNVILAINNVKQGRIKGKQSIARSTVVVPVSTGNSCVYTVDWWQVKKTGFFDILLFERQDQMSRLESITNTLFFLLVTNICIESNLAGLKKT